MDSPEEARDYDAMDHSHVNRLFVADFLAFCPEPETVLDLGTGTAQIPIELCRQRLGVHVVAVDLAEHMLQVGLDNVRRAGLIDRIRLERVDAKSLPYPDGSFPAVISNSIVHHIPWPIQVLAEIVRVLKPGGKLFLRDLVRPESDSALRHLVRLYAEGANDHQQQMFADSLRAALTLEEIRALITSLGFPAATVQQTSDRHWTWATRRIVVVGA
jgi:ubiquinone/menaquinone biosynthesis C-methylase UbiE